LCQWLFERLHPNFGIWLAQKWITKTKGEQPKPPIFLTIEEEWLYQYALKKSTEIDIDYFIFGHRHLPIHTHLPNGKSQYLNMGDWLFHNSYVAFDGVQAKKLWR